MPFATAADGTRLAYETLGSGPPLLLVSGQGNDRHLWGDAGADLAAHHTVILYDHRGTGESDKPEAPPYSIDLFTADALAVLDAAGIERAHVYGVSMGGRIGQWLGIRHGSRLGALVLGCTMPGNTHGVRRTPATEAELLSGDPTRALPYLVSPAWRDVNWPFLQRYGAAVARNPVPRHALRMHYQASEAHDAWHDLPLIQAPTLVIHGSDDEVNATANAPLL